MDRKIKIAVITPGRSHLLDMSKQFLNKGAEVTFYTVVPKSRCNDFGLPSKNVISFFYICAPLMFIFKKIKLPFDLNRYIYYVVCRIVDILSALFLKKCDILISISGCSVIAARKAKQKFGAMFFVIEAQSILLNKIKFYKIFPKASKYLERIYLSS